METEENKQEGSANPENGTGEGNESKSDSTGESTEDNIVKLSKEDYDKLQQDLGSAKRELKELKKPKETSKETSKETKPDDALLQRVEKLALKTANVTHEDDIELARKTAQKWGMDLEDVLGDEDFQVKLKKQQDSRTNIEATSGVKGDGAGKASSKSKAEHWINSNTPPSDTDVETHKISKAELAKIMQHFVQNKGSNKKFYND